MSALSMLNVSTIKDQLEKVAASMPSWHRCVVVHENEVSRVMPTQEVLDARWLHEQLSAARGKRTNEE